MKTRYIIILFSGLIILGSSCKKSFLEEKTDKALLVPTTLNDFQTLLDNIITMNSTPALNVISVDDYYTNDNGLMSWSTPMERNSYLWQSNIYEGETVPDWNIPYQQVFYANVVLDGLNGIVPDSGTQNTYDQIKGGALFHRAFAIYNLAQLFAAQYDPKTATQQPGIPVRLSSDVNILSVRGTVQETYNQIINDLNAAEGLLDKQAKYKSRPSKAAVEALLSRVYLTMGDYTQGATHATTSLNLNSKLIDYNTLTLSASRPFPAILPNGNDEALFYAILNAYSFRRNALTYIDTALYKSYDENDLRKKVFFNIGGDGYNYNFKGTYTGNISSFSGLATDEVYLTRAECNVRLGKIEDGMRDLNTLMKNRWNNDVPFPIFSADNINDALSLILLERRKELIGRGTRWTDLRRLNTDAQFAVKLNRTINGMTYSLSPNSNRYLFPIPDDEIAASTIAQNPR